MINPLIQNLIITALTFIYVFGLLAILNFCVTKFNLPQDISRKITRIGAGSLIVFLPLYNDLHWSKYLNITIFVVWIILLIQKGLFASDDDEAVKTMTRNGDKSELLKGPFIFRNCSYDLRYCILQNLPWNNGVKRSSPKVSQLSVGEMELLL